MEGSESAWRPVQRLRTHEQVLAAVEEQIVRGNLRPGDRLPSERELAELLGVSRPSVREALRVLEWMGVVVAGVGSGRESGSIITGKTSDALTRLLRLHLALSNFSLEDVVRIRLTLEAAAVEGAVASSATADLDELVSIIDRMADDRLEPHDFIELDTEFHTRIAAASGNRLLAEVMQALRDAVKQHMVRAFERLPDWRSVAANLCTEHRAILAAIETHDAAAATAAVTEHIQAFYRSSLDEDVPAAAL